MRGGMRLFSSIQSCLCVLLLVILPTAFDFSTAPRPWPEDLDPPFGVAGRALPAITGASSITVRALAVQSDRQIVCLGDYRHSSTGNQDFVLFRLLDNGSLDTSFGSGGWVVTDFGGCDWAKDLAILDDGRIVAVGGLEPTCGYEDDYQGLIARYHSNGSLDAAFSGDGRMMLGEGNDFFWNAAAVQEDGRLVVVGNHAGPILRGPLHHRRRPGCGVRRCGLDDCPLGHGIRRRGCIGGPVPQDRGPGLLECRSCGR